MRATAGRLTRVGWAVLTVIAGLINLFSAGYQLYILWPTIVQLIAQVWTWIISHFP